MALRDLNEGRKDKHYPGNLYHDSNHIRVGDNWPVVNGSSKVSGRDPSSEVNWWGVAQPTRLMPIPVDSAGRMMRLCSSGHYASIDHYAKNKARKDGKDNYCLDCRRTINRRAAKTVCPRK